MAPNPSSNKTTPLNFPVPQYEQRYNTAHGYEHTNREQYVIAVDVRSPELHVEAGKMLHKLSCKYRCRHGTAAYNEPGKTKIRGSPLFRKDFERKVGSQHPVCVTRSAIDKHVHDYRDNTEPGGKNPKRHATGHNAGNDHKRHPVSGGIRDPSKYVNYDAAHGALRIDQPCDLCHGKMKLINQVDVAEGIQYCAAA